MSKKKKFFISLIIIVVIIQFIRPAKNVGEIYSSNNVVNVIETKAEVKSILEKACFDCHSNNTIYPWYYNIQPVGFWLEHHVNEGKEELNFSEFKTFKRKRQLHKLEELVELIKGNEMPLSSYTWLHSEAKLTDLEKELLIDWAEQGMKSLQQAE